MSGFTCGRIRARSERQRSRHREQRRRHATASGQRSRYRAVAGARGRRLSRPRRRGRRTLLPQTEADPVALLLQYLVYFGNAVGRGPYYQVENDKHFAILFVLLVGNTARHARASRPIAFASSSTWPIPLGCALRQRRHEFGRRCHACHPRPDLRHAEGRDDVIDPGVKISGAAQRAANSSRRWR